ncbi:MAG TPA: GntR family transcriptional regulator, partial [bacterium]|nr:GntR family transcriptional regulator [bacterium]
MVFELNKESDVPLYTQIERRMTELIRVGILKADEKLPATRDLALQLHVHRNTVVQAYQELEVKGFVYSEVGRGTFVSKHAHVAAKGTVAAQNKSGNFSFDGLYAEHWINPEDPSMQAIDTIVRTCSKPQDMIAFSSVVPDKHFFPLVDFQNCSYRAIQKYGVDLLEMGDTQGFRPFVEYLPKFLVRRGLTVQSSD